jgi:hypothetical protein
MWWVFFFSKLFFPQICRPFFSQKKANILDNIYSLSIIIIFRILAKYGTPKKKRKKEKKKGLAQASSKLKPTT